MNTPRWAGPIVTIIVFLISGCGSAGSTGALAQQGQERSNPTAAPVPGTTVEAEGGNELPVPNDTSNLGTAQPGPTPAERGDPPRPVAPPIERRQGPHGEVLCWSDEGVPWEFSSDGPREWFRSLQRATTWWARIDAGTAIRTEGEDAWRGVYRAMPSVVRSTSEPPRTVDSPSEVFLNEFSAAPLERDYEAVLVASTPTGDTLADVFVRVEPGRWSYIGACGAPVPDALRDLIATHLANFGQPGIPVDHVLFEFVSGLPLESFDGDVEPVDPAIVTAVNRDLDVAPAPTPAPPKWEDQDPAVRSVPDAPPETQAQYRSMLLAVDVPESWRGPSGSLCSRTASAWGACVSLDFEWGEPSDYDFLPLDGFALPGENLEVYLLNADADVRGPRAILGTLGGEALDEAGFIDVVIETSATAAEALSGSADITLTLAESD